MSHEYSAPLLEALQHPSPVKDIIFLAAACITVGGLVWFLFSRFPYTIVRKSVLSKKDQEIAALAAEREAFLAEKCTLEGRQAGYDDAMTKLRAKGIDDPQRLQDAVKALGANNGLAVGRDAARLTIQTKQKRSE